MRIAVPIHGFGPGGAERVALRLAEHWQSIGQQPIVILGRRRGASITTAPRLDYRTRPEPFPTDRWETIWLIWSLYQFLCSETVDALFCPGNTYTAVCVLMKVLLGRRCPPVLVKISNDLERRDLPLPVRLLYRMWLQIQGAFLDRFVAIAAPMRQEIERELAVRADRVCVIPDPALSTAEVAQLAACRSVRRAPDHGCRFLTVGRLVTQKNHTLLLDAFARARRSGDSLVIAGDGPERERLGQQAMALGLGDHVRFIGHIEDVTPLYAKADIFVLSSLYEGAPAVIVEALAAGLPMAVTNCCASMEMLTGNGRFGTAVVPGDAAALATAMDRARTLPLDRNAMRRLAETFTLEKSGTLYLDQLQSLAAAGSRHP